MGQYTVFECDYTLCAQTEHQLWKIMQDWKPLVGVSEPSHRTRYEDFYFCSQECKDKFIDLWDIKENE